MEKQARRDSRAAGTSPHRKSTSYTPSADMDVVSSRSAPYSGRFQLSGACSFNDFVQLSCSYSMLSRDDVLQCTWQTIAAHVLVPDYAPSYLKGDAPNLARY
jgi:hypothetical protein